VDGWGCEDLSAGASDVDAWPDFGCLVVADFVGCQKVEVLSSVAGEGGDGWRQIAVGVFEFVECVGAGDSVFVDVENEKMLLAKWSGGDADPVAGIESGVPVADDLEVGGGVCLP